MRIAALIQTRLGTGLRRWYLRPMRLTLRLSAILWMSAALCAAELRMATFKCDVTPPLGHPLCGGWIQPLAAVDDPLLAKGIVLEDGARRYVLCAVDWCLLQTGAYELFARKIAMAAGTCESQVAVHTVHQHNAPIADSNAQRVLDETENSPLHLDLAFLETVTDRLAVAVREACGQLRPFTHVGHGQSRVERFASNRRVRLADGAIHVRYSATRDPVLRAAPEGLIDPWLRTITLFDGEQPLARMHYYASHPMSYYGDGRATADTVGLAREQMEHEEKVAQIYFTGCAGNITAGKYNDGSPQARQELTGRIYRAMIEAAASTKRLPVERVEWRTARVRFAPRADLTSSMSAARSMLSDTNASSLDRLKAALDLAWLDRLEADPTVTISRLALGPVMALHLPAESFVEYQLFAQSLRPEIMVAVAAYGESGPGYICTDAALNEGGYEPTVARVGPPTEWEMKRAITELLAPISSVDVPFYPDKQHLLWWRDSDGFEHAVRGESDWNKRRAHILASFEQVTGPLPAGVQKAGLDVETFEEIERPAFTLRRITYVAEPGDRVPAWLLLPRDRKGPGPAVLCFHQTTPSGKAEPAGLKGDPELHYAAELAGRGYVALAPDYPGFGEHNVDPYELGYASATRKGILNHQRAIDLLETLPEVDPRRIGAMGHSLGGHNALFLAVTDTRVRAVVTSCGFNAFSKYYHGDLSGWSHAGYMPRIATVFGCDPLRMPFDFTELLAALAPRPVFINAPRHDANFELSGVHDCLAAAMPVYRLFGAEAALVARHPECGHAFPREIREAAYEWLDEVLAIRGE
jgi:dienelactone hydrolase